MCWFDEPPLPVRAPLQAGLGVWPSLRQLNPQPSVAAREAQHSPPPLLPRSHSNRSSMGALSAAGGSQRGSQRAGAGQWGDAESGVSGRSSRSASPTPLHSRSRTQLLSDGEADPRVSAAGLAGPGATHGSVGPREERREQLGGPSARRVGWTPDVGGGGAERRGSPGAVAGGAVPPLLLGGGGRDAAAALAAATAGMAFTNERQRQRMEPMLEMWHAAAGVDGEVRMLSRGFTAPVMYLWAACGGGGGRGGEGRGRHSSRMRLWWLNMCSCQDHFRLRRCQALCLHRSPLPHGDVAA